MRLSDLPGDEELLAEYAEQVEDGAWVLTGDVWRYTTDSMLALIKICVVLEQPVRSVASSDWAWALVKRMAAIEERLGLS